MMTMIIGEIIFIRMFILEILLKYDKEYEKYERISESNEISKRNSKILASVLYLIITDEFRNKLEVV